MSLMYIKVVGFTLTLVENLPLMGIGYPFMPKLYMADFTGNWVVYADAQKLSSLDTNLVLTLGMNFSTLLFVMGLFGMLWNQKNIIVTFLCVELMLFGAGLQFLFYYLFLNYALGQVVPLLMLTMATSETAIGLGIIMLAYRQNSSVSFEAFTLLKG